MFQTTTNSKFLTEIIAYTNPTRSFFHTDLNQSYQFHDYTKHNETLYFRARICQISVGTQAGISPLSLIRQFLLSNFTDTRKFYNPRTCHARHVTIRDLITQDFIPCPYSLIITLLLSVETSIPRELSTHNRQHSDIFHFHQLKNRISRESSPSTLRMKIK